MVIEYIDKIKMCVNLISNLDLFIGQFIYPVGGEGME